MILNLFDNNFSCCFNEEIKVLSTLSRIVAYAKTRSEFRSEIMHFCLLFSVIHIELNSMHLHQEKAQNKYQMIQVNFHLNSEINCRFPPAHFTNGFGSNRSSDHIAASHNIITKLHIVKIDNKRSHSCAVFFNQICVEVSPKM